MMDTRDVAIPSHLQQQDENAYCLDKPVLFIANHPDYVKES